MNTRVLFALTALLLLPFALASRSMAQSPISQTPIFPAPDGTYFYDGYDAANDRYVYINSDGNYTYVIGADGSIVTGGQADHAPSPYRTTVVGGTNNFQFYNNHAALHTTTETGGTSYAVRTGTWVASNVTFTIPTTDASALWIEGASSTFSAENAANFSGTVVTYDNGSARVLYDSAPVFIGHNVYINGDAVSNSSRQAVSIRNNASVFLYGGTITKTSDPGSAGSETFYMVSNQTGYGGTSYFRGEDLTITVSGSGLEVFNQSNGNTITQLYRTTITATGAGTPTTQAFYLNDSQDQGGAHFYGESVTITNHQGRTFAIGDGENTVTLVNSTLTTTGSGAAFGWNATTSSTGDRTESCVTLRNTNVTSISDYAPLFQQIGDIARITVTGGTLTTTGEGSPIIRLIAQNDNGDSTRNNVTLTNTVLNAANASAIDINIDAAYTAAYGQAGGGGKNIGTKVEDYHNIIVQSSTVSGDVAAIRIAAAGIGASTYTQNTNLFVYDSTFSGGIEMVAGRENFLYNFASGGNLILTASNSVFNGGLRVTGTEASQRHNQGILHVYDSSWTGDIDMTNRGNITLHFTNSPIDGDLSLSGSTRIQLRLANSPITGVFSATDTAKITGYVLGDGQIGAVNAHGGLIDLDLDHVPSGGITATGAGVIALRIGNEVAIPDGVQVSGSSSVSITLRDTTTLTSNVTVIERGTFALATANGAAVLAGNVNLAGIWSIPVKTTLAGDLIITDSLGTISIANAGTDSLVLANGMTGNGRLSVTSFSSDGIGLAEIRLIHDRTGALDEHAFLLAHPVDNGLVSYGLENRPDGAYLIGGLGAGGAAVINSQSLAVEEWFAALTPLNLRFSQLREANDAVFAGDLPPAFGDAGSFWFQGRADTTRVDLSGTTLDFESRVIGMAVGGDTRWDLDTGSFTLGVYASASRTDRDFDGTGDGHTTGAGGGLYLHYQHRNGLFASANARFDIYETSLNTNSSNNDFRADYDSRAGGLAVDLGWHRALASSSGWWFEPAYQLALVTLPGVSYTTKSNKIDGSNIIDIDTDDTTATQHTFRFAFGRKINESWSFRGHILSASIDASGGKFTAEAGTSSPADFNNTDRTIAEDRVEISIGVSRQIGRAGRLSLDLAYTEADSYERPCSVSIGYIHRW